MTVAEVTREGFVPVRGYRTWYRIVGDISDTESGKLPLLAVHGGPISHESLEPLEQLAESGRPVVFYDQLGCGRSDRPDVSSPWSIQLFVDELATVRRELGLDRLHLLGHSWGGVVALEYMLSRPTGVMSLILHSSCASFAMLDADWDMLRSQLPETVRETLSRHEAAGSTDDPEYLQAHRVFDLRHICRIDPWPDFLQRACERLQVAEPDVGGWDIRSRLGEIRVPTLILSGQYDISTPEQNQILHRGISDSEWVLFEHSSHYAHAEEPARYFQVLEDFLTRADNAAR